MTTAEIEIERAQKSIGLHRKAMFQIAATRVIQEGRSQSLCDKGGATKVFPTCAIPEGWREFDCVGFDSPELAQLVHGY